MARNTSKIWRRNAISSPSMVAKKVLVPSNSFLILNLPSLISNFLREKGVFLGIPSMVRDGHLTSLFWGPSTWGSPTLRKTESRKAMMHPGSLARPGCTRLHRSEVHWSASRCTGVQGVYQGAAQRKSVKNSSPRRISSSPQYESEINSHPSGILQSSCPPRKYLHRHSRKISWRMLTLQAILQVLVKVHPSDNKIFFHYGWYSVLWEDCFIRCHRALQGIEYT